MRAGYRILLLSIATGCFLSNSAVAQHVTTTTNVFIPQGLGVTVNGSLDNSGFILNNGSITLSGNWQNTAVYQGLGTVTLNGSDQQIQNNSQSIHALSIEGDGIKTLTGTLVIDRLLTFNEGIVKVGDGDTLAILYTGATEGGSSLSYVDGALLAHGIGYKFFPVGKNGKYHPVELLDVTGILPRIEIEVQENLPAIQTSHPSTPFTDIYWTRKVVEGTYEGSPIVLHYNVPEDIAADHLVVLEGESLSEVFTTRETTLERAADLDRIESHNTRNGNIIALAELAGEPPREYYLSTTLSPNASNPENRAIKVLGDIAAKDFRFQVFNRWGKIVYESTSAADMSSQGWDGRQNGNMLMSGVYPYSLSYVDTTGKVTKRSGFITIIQ